MNPQQHKHLFVQLIASMATAVMQHLGKLVSPMTGKTELNLEAAQQTIDVIEMLEAKTRSDRDDEESRMIKQTLAMLQLNYVETAAKPPAPAPAAPTEQPATEAAPEGGKARFHKTYGET